jgi:membrane-bound lytic murein transglycosylase D
MNSLFRVSALGLLALIPLAGCQTSGGPTAQQFDALPDGPNRSATLAPVEPRTVAQLLADAEEAFQQANAAQEEGNYEEALRNYNYMLELMIDADLDPAVFYNLRQEFARIISTTNKQAPLYERGDVRQWTAADFRRVGMAGAIPIPDPLPQRVVKQIERIQHGYPKNFQRGLDRAALYLPYIRNRFAKAGLPEDLAWLAMVESQFHPGVTSRVGAGGMWQFMRGTARRYKIRIDNEVDERYNWQRETEAAIGYLGDLYAQFGSWDLALSAYNRGEGGIERIIAMNGGDTNWWRLMETPPAASHIPRETKDFYPKFLASLIISRNPEKYGFTLNPSKDTLPERVPVRGAYALADIEKALGLSLNTLVNLNPDLVRKTTPFSGEHQLAVPTSVRGRFATAMKSVAKADAGRYNYAGGSTGTHTVRRGDTLSEIAQRYRTSVKAIMNENNIRSAKRIKVGQRLRVPTAGSSRSTTASATNGGLYTVRRGDALSTIASRHGVTVTQLQQWNNMGKRTRLIAGKQIRVASATKAVVAAPKQGEKIIHVVQAGEYPAKIASAYSVKTADLLSWNKLSSRSVIRVGDKLAVYGGKGGATTTTGSATAKRGGEGQPPNTTVVHHTVTKGENPSVIAEKLGVRLSDFQAWNKLTKRSVVHIGDNLVAYVPSTTPAPTQVAAAQPTKAIASPASEGTKQIHTVAQGQSPWTISRQYGVPMKDLYTWNGWEKAPVLQIGSEVVVYLP